MSKVLNIALKIKYMNAVSFIFAIAAVVLSFKNIDTSEAALDQAITDQNGDGVINLVDARILAPPATTSCLVCVDVNGDKKIDSMDVYLVRYHAGLESPDEGRQYSYKPRLDVNNDGTLSQTDADVVQTYIGQAVQAPAFGLDDPSELTFGYVANEVIVKFKNGIGAQQKNPVFSKYSATDQRSLTFINADKIKINTSNLENLQKQLKNEPDVENVYKNHVGEWLTNDTYWENQWGHKKIKIEETWNTETKGSESNPVKVGLLDSGVDINHLDLLHNISWEHINLIPGENIEEMSDETGHGTAMAGIIGATVDNSTGIAGLNYDVDILSVKAAFQRVPTDFTVTMGFEWLMYRVKVINMSFGLGYVNDTNYLPNEYLRMAKEDYGITLIAAAGDDGRNDCEYPARSSNVVCVGATKQNDAMCVLSNGRTDADILAPGSNIVTTVPEGHALDPDRDGIATVSVCNTSIASAYVSGVAALCQAVVAQDAQFRPDLYCGKFEHQGYGRIDAQASIWYKNCYKFDFNGNGFVGIADAQALAFRYNNPYYSSLYDITPVGRDNKIDFADALLILARLGLSCPPR